jgi:hypothetical protein
LRTALSRSPWAFYSSLKVAELARASSVFDYSETESNGKKQLLVRREAFEHACPFGGFKKRGQGEG